MASLLALAGGALINAVAFSGNNYMFHNLSSSDKERHRHNLATENFQKNHNAWIEKRQNMIDAQQKRRQSAQTAGDHMLELDSSMRQYATAWEAEHPKPKFHQYYHPSEHQKKKDYLSALVSIAAIGGFAYYVL